jgi:hypothetical protein
MEALIVTFIPQIGISENDNVMKKMHCIINNKTSNVPSIQLFK